MPGIAHFYHVYAVGGWRDVVAEHLDAVVGSGLPIAAINLGVVGTPERGYPDPHIHTPPVIHHHMYPFEGCACGDPDCRPPTEWHVTRP
jgi:hypothetical protein